MSSETNAGSPSILEIKGNALDDGPGIRSVIFFKGCPLSCVWCHNPEGKKAAAEIAFDAAECIGCDACLKICPEAALSRANPRFIDRRRCMLCFLCADACPSGAISRVGREMSVDAVVNAVMKDKPFFDTSGGGVTLSGGEPAIFPEFASELLRRLKACGIDTLIETCGLFDFENFRRMLLPHLDAVYYDIKLIDDAGHRRFTGASNARILDNFLRLVAAARGTSLTILPRIPLIPGITDTDANIAGIVQFLARAGIRRAAVMSYNPLWRAKAQKIGADDPSGSDAGLTTWLDADRLARCRDMFLNAGIRL